MRITLAHGSGGREMGDLIRKLFPTEPSALSSKVPTIGIEAFDDGAVIMDRRGGIVVSADSYTVKPIFFPGGDIGKLAAYGSINDVAVMGADPMFALDCIIVEEGFPVSDLNRIVGSMLEAFRSESVDIIAGDFKVMPKGQLDGVVITTTVMGFLEADPILDSGAKPGDVVVVSGTVGDHGAVITAYQYGIDPEDEGLVSDCGSVLPVMRAARRIGGVHAAKDPTRGGLGMALNEIAKKSRVSIWVREEDIPIRENVRSLMELLGIDPIYLACEGRAVLVVEEERGEALLSELKKLGYRDARIIGEVREERPGYVIMETLAGGYRIVEEPRGELTPRIC